VIWIQVFTALESIVLIRENKRSPPRTLVLCVEFKRRLVVIAPENIGIMGSPARALLFAAHEQWQSILVQGREGCSIDLLSKVG
jgi:hypothetical protein